MVCLPGATLDLLEKALRPFGREPHSVIGSSCIGASVLGGICNNSGGALVRRGPAFTEMALYAQVAATGEVELVNHLGIALGNDPEEILARIEAGTYRDDDVAWDTGRAASDPDYGQHVRDVEASTPARFNADPRRLAEASGCAGKLAVFAVRLDTFEAEKATQVFYVGTNDTTELTAIRRHMLGEFASLPIAGEYIHRGAYDVAAVYGKDTYLTIRRLGTDRMPRIFASKARFDAMAERVGFSPASPTVSRSGRARVSAAPAAADERLARPLRAPPADPHGRRTASRRRGRISRSIFPTASGDFFECTAEEGTAAFLHRFAVAGAAVRYREVHRHEVEDIVALDIALRRNDARLVRAPAPGDRGEDREKLYYGHFFCHVFHQDYVAKKGEDCLALEHALWRLLDARGAEYPAEHNVGHLYQAKPALAEFYRSIDPTNALNPGIGQTSKCAHWR